MKTYARIALLVLSAAGVGIMAYLTSLHYAVETGDAFCTFGEGLSCEVVNQSIYSVVFGIPVAVLGLLYFVGVFLLAAWRFSDTTLRWIFFGTLAALGPSVYLTGIELFVLANICVFCELSKVLMVSIGGTALAGVWGGKVRPSWQAIGVALVGALVLAGLTYYAHATVVPAGKYTEFAQCLDEAGMVMYGSEGCSFCAQQRARFGDAFEHIDEVECDPRFPGAQTERCIQKDIQHTPTWIQEDENGNTVHRFDPGVQRLSRLGEIAGCELPSN